MTVGIVTTWFERGAAYVSRQFQETLEKEHKVYIYARGGEKNIVPGPEWEGPRITRGINTVLPYITAIDRSDFCRWLAENEIDTVLFNEQRWWLPVLWCRQLGLKVGAYVDYYTEQTIELFNVYDFLICNTKRHYGVFSGHPQCIYIPWGTDLDVYKPAERFSASDRTLTFFHSAGMNPSRKGTDLLLDAFGRLPDSSRLVIHSQVELVGNLTEQCQLIRKLQQENRLDVIEVTVPAPGLYHLGDVYVYPSRLDGIGLTLVEAAACGLPVIATDFPPMSEFVTNDNGKLVAVDNYIPRFDGYYWPQAIVNIESLCESMLYYVNNIEALPLFKEAARRTAVNRFDWRQNSAELSQIINGMRILQGNEMRRSEALVLNFEKNRESTPGLSNWNKGLMARLRSFAGRMAR